jgi:hypothetical protein
MLRAQQIAQDRRSDKGYAMLMTSMITIAMFSMLAAYMTMTNLSKSSTNAYVDGTNTFYAAESGLNKRAEQLRQKFVGYATPTGDSPGSTTTSVVTAANISNCYSVSVSAAITVTNDFECRNYSYRYNNNIAEVKDSNGNIVLSEQNGNRNSIDYIAYTFVANKTVPAPGSTTTPVTKTIDAGENFAGLKAQEYRYTVYSTAKKPNLSNSSSSTNFTTAEIDAKNRQVNGTSTTADTTLIASYNSKQAQVSATDSSVNTVLQMDFKSRVIPIFQFGAFYDGDLEFNPSPAMNFTGRLHSNGNMYLTGGAGKNLTIDGIVTTASSIYSGNAALVDTYNAGGQVFITKTPGVTQALPTNPDPTTTAVKVTSLTPYNTKVKDSTTPIQRLTLPAAGLLTKVDPNQSDNIGEYYGKADLRLEMFPDRAVPFNLQVISSGTGTTTTGAGACSASGSIFNNSDTGGTKTVSISRNNYSTAQCNDLKEGQLRSLMQPVLVRPRSSLEYETFCNNTASGTGTLPKTSTSPVSIAIQTSTSAADLAVKERILDALYLTLAAQSAPVNYSTLKTTDSLSAGAKLQFRALLDKITTLSDPDKATLTGAAPADIAALSTTTTNGNATKRSCFRPAPIQALFTPSNFNTTAKLAANTATNFNDRRENRYIRMLQTNIESLTLWNRDGLFVQANVSPGVGGFDGDLTTSDSITSANLATKFTIDNVAATKGWTERADSLGDNLLFFKDIARTLETDGTTAIPAQSYRGMGLAGVDRTEVGLVVHATINKTTYTYTALQSPYGFAFNDGMNLPAPLTIATDQAVYSQGDWNVFDKQPASLLADSLALLSNRCLATGDTTATASDPAYLEAQLNCGKRTGINPATPTTVNAAFLARTDRSTYTGTTYYSGGLNNYMRILESWTGVAMNYRGSFVSLGIPQEVSGQYVACSTANTTYGCPPDRNWGYDTDFDDFNKLPPLSPRVIELKQDVFKRTY